LGDNMLQEMRTRTRPFREEVQYDSEVFIFPLPFNQLSACSLIVSILVDKASQSMGGLQVGPQGEEYGQVVFGGVGTGQCGEEAMHWEAVRIRCGETVTRWHALRSQGTHAGQH